MKSKGFASGLPLLKRRVLPQSSYPDLESNSGEAKEAQTILYFVHRVEAIPECQRLPQIDSRCASGHGGRDRRARPRIITCVGGHALGDYLSLYARSATAMERRTDRRALTAILFEIGRWGGGLVSSAFDSAVRV